MGLLGAGIGGILGARGGWLWALIGAAIGSGIEEHVRASRRTGSSGGDEDAGSRELFVLGAISAMLAKMAKADGRVSENEVRYCESVFDRLGLRGEKRKYCIRVFRTAKNDAHSIYAYASSFAAEQTDESVREIVYDILWDLACVDGRLGSAEREILRQITGPLGVNPRLYAWQCSRRHVSEEGARAPTRDDPYAVLGCARTASDEELRNAFRAKAKRLHPDMLRAQGLSEELVGRATEQMARLNAAWDEIKKERGIAS